MMSFSMEIRRESLCSVAEYARKFIRFLFFGHSQVILLIRNVPLCIKDLCAICKLKRLLKGK